MNTNYLEKAWKSNTQRHCIRCSLPVRQNRTRPLEWTPTCGAMVRKISVGKNPLQRRCNHATDDGQGFGGICWRKLLQGGSNRLQYCEVTTTRLCNQLWGLPLVVEVSTTNGGGSIINRKWIHLLPELCSCQRCDPSDGTVEGKWGSHFQA